MALEGSELLEERFAEFGEEVVLFCHITSHVEGEKFPDLLSQIAVENLAKEKGFPAKNLESLRETLAELRKGI